MADDIVRDAWESLPELMLDQPELEASIAVSTRRKQSTACKAHSTWRKLLGSI
jgi:hypothetical protein